MKTKNMFIILGIFVGIALLVGTLFLLISNTAPTLFGGEFIPLKIDNREISCISNQDCTNAVISKFPSATNLDVICLNEICSVKSIKSSGKKI